MTPIRFLLLGPIYALGTVFGMWLLLRGLDNIRGAAAAQSLWVEVNGRVLDAKRGPGEWIRAKGIPLIHLFALKIEYEYSFQDREFRGTHLYPWQEQVRGREGWVNALLQQYGKGQPCKVYVNPNAPQEACLLRDVDIDDYWCVVFGLPLAVFAGVLFIQGLGNLLRCWPDGLPPPIPLGDEWFEVQRSEPLTAGQVWSSTVLVVVGLGYAIVDFFLSAATPFARNWLEVVMLLLTAIAIAVGLVIGLSEWRSYDRRFGRPRLFVMPYPAVLGGILGLRVMRTVTETLTMRIHFQLEVNGIEIRLSPKGETFSGNEAELLPERAAIAGEDLEGEKTIFLPERVPGVGKTEDLFLTINLLSFVTFAESNQAVQRHSFQIPLDRAAGEASTVSG